MTEQKGEAQRAKREEGKGVQARMPGVEDLLALSGGGVEAYLRCCEASLKGLASINEEVAHFADQRIRASFETAQSLMKATDPAEAVRTQVDFARSATEQYLQEATKLLNLATQVAMDSLGPIQGQVTTAFGLLPRK